ncbi:MAG TPA: transposase [Chloroflexia bacterium]|nr:transposase [Chloroflexia bacterium]
MSLPTPIIQVLLHFRPAFTRPTWHKVLVLMVGTILARGRRTMTAALKQMGLYDEQDFTLFHQVLNRASWSCLALSRLLLQLLISTFVQAGGTLEIVIDKTLERRWGRKIAKRGHYRDNLQSSKEQSVSISGLRWVVMMLVVGVPWTRREWALPFFSVLATTPKVSEQLGKPHKTVAQIAAQMVITVRRWLPTIPMKLVGDTAYSVLELGLCCTRHDVTLIAPLRWDASLHEPAPPRREGTIGRPRVKGESLPKLRSVLEDIQSEWHSVKVKWYDGTEQLVEIASGTGVWYRIGLPVLPLRWVLTRDTDGKLEPRAYLCTDQSLTAVEVVSSFIKRWTIEVTFEESRAHLGVETQRQWSDLAIERSTPCLLGMFSLVALLGAALHPDGKVPVQRTAWYDKKEATFSDVLAQVRRHLWGNFTFQTSHKTLMSV